MSLILNVCDLSAPFRAPGRVGQGVVACPLPQTRRKIRQSYVICPRAAGECEFGVCVRPEGLGGLHLSLCTRVILLERGFGGRAVERSLCGPRLPASHAFRFPSVESRGPAAGGTRSQPLSRTRAVAWPPCQRCLSPGVPKRSAGKRAPSVAPCGRCRARGRALPAGSRGARTRLSKLFLNLGTFDSDAANPSFYIHPFFQVSRVEPFDDAGRRGARGSAPRHSLGSLRVGIRHTPASPGCRSGPGVAACRRGVE